MLRPRARAGRSVSWCALTPALELLLAIALLLAISSTADAQNRFWITPGGGAFGTNANWSATLGGAGGATPPGATDIANFTLNSVSTVSFAADVTNAGAKIGNGSVTFDLGGKNYIVTNNSATAIGTTAAQTGRLTIRNGAFGSDSGDDVITIGQLATSIGFLTISTQGRLGVGSVRPDLLLGGAGTGTLTMEENGVASVGYLVIGDQTTGTGTLTVSGPNAKVDTESVIDVGVRGNATVTVQNSAELVAGLNVTFGTNVGANGTATVTGVGSTWTQNGGLTLGVAGDGTMNVAAGGLVATAGAVSVGSSATGVGAAIISGSDSAWDIGGALQLGVSGRGNFAVTTGARASTAGTVQMAVNAASESNAVVSGAGSRWTTGAMTVGGLGTANLTIGAGAELNTTGLTVVGSGASGVGKVLVNGANSAWNIAGALTIAGSGAGTVTVENDGVLSTTGTLTIADPAGAVQGTLNLKGGSISAAGFTRDAGAAFNWTGGTLLVNGGVFNNGGADLSVNGSSLTDLPALRLSAGATANATQVPNLTIGSNRQGSVIVSGGSNFQVMTASLGTTDGGTGSLHVEGAGSNFTTTGDLGLGGTTTAAGGLGGITLGPGGIVSSQGTLRLWSGGTINLVGGTLQFGSLAANGGKMNFNSGTVRALTSLNASAAVLDAMLGPTHVLGPGRRIETAPGLAMNLQSNLSAVGGAIGGGSLALNSDVVARFESGANATFTSGITNPAGARIYATDSTVSAGTTFANNGELHLAGSTATINGTAFNNSGLVEGSGRVNMVITNNTAGQVRVGAGQRMEILGSTGNSVNNGLVDVDGGEIEFGRQVTNSNVSPSSGLIAARDATLRFHGSLVNNGSLTFSAGVSDVFGDIANQNNLTTPGRIIVTGGAQANFFDDVVNNGGIQVSGSGGLLSTAVFLGSLSGAGTTGTGRVFLEGDTRPGFSPGTMAFGGDVSFGPQSTLNIELAGTAAGTQYDRVAVAQSASLAGDLSVTLLDNFKPQIGSTFQILTASSLAGTFDEVELPALAGGAKWGVTYGAGAVSLSVGGVLGDFNLDDRVDAADYVVWRNTRGTNAIAADASGNGSIDQADYNIWKANFGAVAAGSGGAGATAAVPEPSAFAFVASITLAVVRRRRV